MKPEERKKIGVTCAYAPVQIIHAAGFTPYRILPVGDSPDQAGQLLHDNMCPHVKKVLDRALNNDIPKFSGLVFINSCDSMRRVAGAWRNSRPSDNLMTIDLPSSINNLSVSYLGSQYKKMSETLHSWGGEEVTENKLQKSIELYNELKRLTEELKAKLIKNKIPGGNRTVQEIYNLTGTEAPEIVIEKVKNLLSNDSSSNQLSDLVPIFLFGNVLPDEEVFDLFEECGVAIIDDDLCTGSRYISSVTPNGSENLFLSVSDSILSSPPCARSFNTELPGDLSNQILKRAEEMNAKGVIGYTLKFCDPYLSRLPDIRETLRNQSIPFLLLEGDCSTGTIGQQQTRIEAFIEMLR